MLDWLTLPPRPSKPRIQGLNCLIDNGVTLAEFKAVVESFHTMIDVIKYGWCTAYLTPGLLVEKQAIASAYGITTHVGGTFFEKAVMQQRLEPFCDFLDEFSFKCVEISDGTIALDDTRKLGLIQQLAERYQVMVEVGYKSAIRAQGMTPEVWVQQIQQALAAGAKQVILEARESGSGGFCDDEGRGRGDVLELLQAANLPLDVLIFEAPTKALQSQLITLMGPQVNLANLPMGQVIAVETLRLGLRSETLDLSFEETPCI